MSQIHVALYDGTNPSVRYALDLPWGDLVDLLSQFNLRAADVAGEAAVNAEPRCSVNTCSGKICPAKLSALAWSPVKMREPHRANENVMALSCFVADLDHVTELDGVRARLAGHAALIHSTHSHAPPDGAYRLVMPLSRAVSPDEYRRLRSVFVSRFAPEADPACKDASRFYFAATSRGGAEPHVEVLEGLPVDVDAALTPTTTPPAYDPGDAPTDIAPTSDLAELRAALKKVRAMKAQRGRTDPDAKEQADLLGRVLNGEPIAGVGGRHAARVRLGGMLGRWLPDGTSWETVHLLVRASLGATPHQPGEPDPVEKTRKIYEESVAWWRARRAELAEQDRRLADLLLSKKSGAEPSVEAVAESGVDWRELLILGKDGEPRACESNILTILTHDETLRGTMRFNMATKEIECSGALAGTRPNELGIALAIALQSHGCMAAAWQAESVALSVAREREFDPIVEYLEGLKWDGSPRASNALVRYFGAEDSEYTRLVSRRWLIALAARGLQPGCELHEIVVLEGAQGVGKSRGLRALVGPDWFDDSQFRMGGKDGYLKVSRAWLLELGELASLRGEESAVAKNFITAARDTFRPPYGKVEESFPRRAVLVGTTNDSEYLHDSTGARRYLPVHVEVVDVDAIARDRDQLLAEAVVAYRAGERWHWTAEERKRLQADVAEERHEIDPWAEDILAWCANPEAFEVEGMKRTARIVPVTTRNVMLHALRIPIERRDKRTEMRVAGVLRHAGWEQKREGEKKIRVWYKPTHRP